MKIKIFLLSFWALFLIPVAAAENADLILFNGKIITVDAGNRIAQAVAVKDGRILQVGANQEMKALAGTGCRMIDLLGKTVTPGLIDSHYHVLYYGMQFWPGYVDIRFPKAQSKADLLSLLAEKAKGLKKGEWISANQGFHLRPSETLDRRDLDQVIPDNPAYLRHGSGQFAVVNTAALKIAGIDKNTPDPPSSKILRDRDGEPTGVLSHYPAENLVAKFAPGYGDRTEADMFKSIDRGQRLCFEAGYTSAQDVIVGNPRDIQAYLKFAAAGRLKIRLYLLLYVNNENQARQYIRMADSFKSEKVVFGGWKLAIDGGSGGGTMLMYDKNMPGARMAYPYFSQNEFNRLVKILHDTGLQVAVHVGGDQGIDMTITAFEEALKANPRPDARHRIEHCLFPTTDALARIKKAGIVVSTSPQWIAWHGDMFALATSPQAMEHFLPLKSIVRMGIPLAFGCDVPASIFQEPRWAFIGAVLRRSKGETIGPQERITIQEALRAHTMGSAYAGFAEKTTGSIEAGKAADFVVWNHDLYTMRGNEAADLKPEMTIVNGEIVFQADR